MIELSVFFNDELIKKVVFTHTPFTIGRSPENDLVLNDKHVSRRHLIIQRKGEQFILEDTSANGVELDGNKVAQSLPLPTKGRIRLFPFEINYICHEDDKTVPVSIKDILPPVTPETTIRKPTNPSTAITYHYGCLVGEGEKMTQLYRLIEDVAPSKATVLIRGEHGTGKELVARSIHAASPRKTKPMITVNCAAIPVDLIESELFGHEKGAFTGAHTSQKGKVAEAEGGTLFLDEIGELTQAAQAKLLRFLQDHSFMRLGSGKEVRADVRIIAATNKNLEAAINDGTFRADLYYRLQVLKILVPPLKEHSEDIPLLVAHFLQKFMNELSLMTEPSLTPEAMQSLQSEKWPGNIRQLENKLLSALIHSRPPHQLTNNHFDVEMPTRLAPDEVTISPLETLSKKLLIQTLEENQWDTTRVAEILQVSRGTIYYRLKKYGINLQSGSRLETKEN